MGLKQSAGMTRPQTPVGEAVGPVTADAEESKEDQKD